MAFNKIDNDFVNLNNQDENYINLLTTSESLTEIGWSIYNDGSTSIPVDGLGGSTNITWNKNISSPLSGEVDIRLVKDASNRRGEGVGINFTVDNRHLAKVLQITFDTELISGTFATHDLKVYIIQDPTGTPVVIEPVNTGIQLGIANQRIRHIATFQTHISVTSYRLCIHVASTSTSAYTVDFANFRVWEPTQSIGAVITDWQSYTPTGSWVTNATYTGRWRRVGSNLEVRGRVTLTGATTAATLTITLPSGFSIDSSSLPSGNTIIGEANGITGSGSNSVVANVFVAGTSSVSFSWIVSNGASPNPVGFAVLTNTSPLTFGNGDHVSFKYSVPVAGWGSSISLSSDSSLGRVVACKYTNAQAGTTNNPVIYNTQQFDTHNAYSTSTGLYTVPVSGIYRVSASLSSNSQIFIQLYKGSNLDTILDQVNTASSGLFAGGSTLIQCNAGDTLSIRPNGASVTASSSFISIERISADSQVIGSERMGFATWIASSGSVAQVPRFFKVKDSFPTITQGWQLSTNTLLSDSYMNNFRSQSPDITTHPQSGVNSWFRVININDTAYIFSVNKLYKTVPKLGPYAIINATSSYQGSNPSFNYLAYSPTLDKFVGVCNSNTFMREVRI